MLLQFEKEIVKI